MSVVVPEPVPLDQPDERPDALADLVLSVAGAAESLALVGDGLAGTPGAVPHWIGADAEAAASQLRRVRKLIQDCSAAVLSVAGRLSVHADRLATIRSAVAGLRTEQHDDFTATWRRLGQLPGYGAAVITDAPEAGALIEELRASEEGRRRRHAALLEELAADAAATARVLVDAAGVVGGRGAPGDGNRVTGRLAPELPGWGGPEVTARGRALAEALLDAAPGDLRSLVGDAAPYADQAAFVDGLLLGLGVDGLRELLGRLGETELSSGRVVARLLGHALGSARPTGAAYDPIAELFTATYIDPAASGLADDRVVLGMGVVLAATRSTDGPPLGLVAAWGRQMLARERLQARGVMGTRAFDRDRSADAALPHDDAVALVVERLAGADDHAFAAQFLDRTSWDVLLSRPWDDRGTVLSALVHAAALEPGRVGDLAVRAGLEALGGGLADGGDPDGWPVDRVTARAISPALGGALVAHLTVATDALVDGADAWITTPTGDVLRGLGYLTLDRSVAADLERALAGWARVQPMALDPTASTALLPAVAVPAAFEAVREYGQRLAYALQAYEKKAVAGSRAWVWNHTVTLAADLAPGPLGTPAGIAAGYLAMVLDFDGTWDNGRDRGLRFDQVDAVAAARAALPPEKARAIDALARQAVGAYAGTAFALGDPTPPTSPESHWWGPLVGALQPGPDEVLTAGRAQRGRLPGGRALGSSLTFGS